ncbi:MAG: glycosyltransferase family 39 protein [Chloroflexia bacterium]|nr:glycosyltransferase family 39 protein [Chloroflexia bacterium]
MALLFFLSFGLNLDKVDVTPFHPDESRWLHRSFYLEDLRDPFGETWQDYYLTRGQPPLGSYMMGIGQLVQDRPLRPNIAWDFFFDRERGWNETAGAMPSAEDLRAGRQTSGFVGALVVAAVYLLGRLLTNRVGGLAAGFFLAYHPLHMHIGSQALSDQLLNLLLTLTFLTAFMFARRPTWAWAVTLGVLFGLGGAAKLSPLLLSLPATALGLYFFMTRSWFDRALKGATRDRRAFKLIVQPVIAFGAFVVAYPYLWVAPLQHTYNLFRFRVDEMEAQGMVNDRNRVENSWIALDRIGNRIGEQWQTSAGPVSALNERYGLTLNPFGFDPMLAMIGLVLFGVLVFRHGIRSSHAFVLLLVLAESGAIVLGLRSDLYRYQLPLVLVEAICISVLAGVIWRALAPFDAFSWLRGYIVLPFDAGRLRADDPLPRPVPVPGVRKPASRVRSDALPRREGLRSPSLTS